MDADVIARLDRLEACVAELTTENAELRAHLDRPGPDEPTPGAAPVPAPVDGRAVGRRSVLTKGLAAAGAATAGAMVVAAGPAAATDNQALIVGTPNSSTKRTVLVSEVSGDSSFFVRAIKPTSIALEAASDRAPLWLQSRPTGTQPPNDAILHEAGEIVVDLYGNLWYCHTRGTPGTWRTLSGPGHAGGFFPHTAPIRAYDSRPGTRPANPGPKTKLATNQTRTINLRPTGAGTANTKGVLVHVLLVNATAGNGNFTIWSGGVAKPLANTMVWGGNSGRFSTLTYTNVDRSGNVQIHASLATNVVLDVVGIYG